MGYKRQRIAPAVIVVKLVALETAGNRSNHQRVFRPGRLLFSGNPAESGAASCLLSQLVRTGSLVLTACDFCFNVLSCLLAFGGDQGRGSVATSGYARDGQTLSRRGYGASWRLPHCADHLERSPPRVPKLERRCGH